MYNGFTPTGEYEKAAARASALRAALIELMGHDEFVRWANTLSVNTHLDRKQFAEACAAKMQEIEGIECIANGENICTCPACNPPMPNTDEMEQPY